MKVLKARYDLITVFFISFTAIAILSYLFFFEELTRIAAINWVFDAALLVFICLPRSSQHLGPSSRRRVSFCKWVTLLFLVQLTLNLLLWAIARLNQQNILPFALGMGLFPWGFMICFTLTIGYFTYIKHGSGLLSSAYSPLFQNTHLDSVGIAVDSYLRAVALFCILVGLSLFTLGIMGLLQQITGINVDSGMKPSVVILCLILLLTVSHQGWRKLLHAAMYRRFSPFTILITVAVFLGLAYFLLSQGVVYLNDFIPTLNTPVAFNHTYSEQAHLSLVLGIIGLGFSVVAGAIIATLSQGQQIRNIVVLSLLTNLLAWGVITLLELMSSKNETLPSVVLIVSSLGVLFVMLRPDYLTYFLRATLPSDRPIKPRSPFRFLTIVPILMVTLMGAYLAQGIISWSLFATVFLLPSILVVAISEVTFFIVSLFR